MKINIKFVHDSFRISTFFSNIRPKQRQIKRLEIEWDDRPTKIKENLFERERKIASFEVCLWFFLCFS